MEATTKDLLLHEPRLAVIHSPDFTDHDVLAHHLGSASIADMDPEVVVLRFQLGIPHFIEPLLNKHFWITASFSPMGQTVAAYRTMVEEAVTYATHVLLLWDGKTEWLRECLQGDTAIKRPVKLVRLP